MDRRKFLAFIPSIGAIPLIGKDIIKKDDKIEIIKPEIYVPEKPMNIGSIDIMNAEVHLVVDGKAIGRGWLTNLSSTNRFANFGSERFPSIREITIEAKMNEIEFI